MDNNVWPEWVQVERVEQWMRLGKPVVQLGKSGDGTLHRKQIWWHQAKKKQMPDVLKVNSMIVNK